MKVIGFYRELIEVFNPELARDYPSMVDSFADTPYPNKSEIVSYLNSGTLDAVAGSVSTDVFTGEKTGLVSCSRSDGEYSWGGDLAYYVDRYNLRLPDDFTQHILNQLKKAA